MTDRLFLVEQPGQQQPVILDRVRQLGHMFRHPGVDTPGDGRHVGPDCSHHLGHGLHTGDTGLEGVHAGG
jgi:hypothetical protein